jgi:hypothetical protein
MLQNSTPEYIKQFRELFDIHSPPLEAFLTKIHNSALEEGRNMAIRHVESNVVALDENPLDSRSLQLDTDKFADLLQSARTKQI